MLQIRAFKQPYRYCGISIYIDDMENKLTARPIIMEKQKDEYTESQPPLVLPQESAQKLIDDLWDCGLRPSEGTGSAGQLKATQNHLEDMRKLVLAQPYQELIIKLCNKMTEYPTPKKIIKGDKPEPKKENV